MNRTLFAASVAALALTTVSALASQPEQTKQKTDADARYEALQAQARQQAEERRQAQLRYEQGVAEAAEARRRYEAENARYQAELARSREAQADYERRMREHEADVPARGNRGDTAAAETNAGAASPGTQTASDGRTCEQQQRRNRRRGRTAGGVIGGVAGGVAGGLLGTSNLGSLAAIATLAPVGALIGDTIARHLNCREQLQAAHATEEAVRGGVGTTSTWTSDTRPGVTGSSTVIAADASTPNEAQCLTVTDIVIVDGEETRAPKRMCRRPPSNAFVRV
jgi:hypothetical protein